MKVTVVPAQVTTVEDRIIGNLGFSQMLILIIPVFLGAALFAALPPVMTPSSYKYLIMGMLTLVCCILAIRIKGKIVALWLVTILRYNLRPKFYLFNKNTTALREEYELKRVDSDSSAPTSKSSRTLSIPKLEISEAFKVYNAMDNPATKLRFETTKKGGLNVRLTEIT